MSPERMSPERMREILDQLGWSARHLALDRLHCNVTTVQRMLNGSSPIRAGLAHWLERRATIDESCPPPEDWDEVPDAA